MATYAGKRDPIKLFWRRLGIVALFIALVIALSGVWGVWRKERESRELRNQAQLQAQDLAAQAAQLQKDIARMQTDRGKEEVLREQYNVGAPGEQMIVIVTPDQPKPIAATSTGFQALVHKFLPFW